MSVRMWETLEQLEEREKIEAGDSVPNEFRDMGDIPEPKVMLKQTPSNVWVVATDPERDYEETVGIHKGVPLINFWTRLKPFYYFFLLFGLDISGNKSKCRVRLLKVIRYLTYYMYVAFLVIYLTETFLGIKYRFLEYGSALSHLVMTAALISILVTHHITNSRSEKLVHLLNRLDTIHASMNLTVKEYNVSLLALSTSLFFTIGWLVFPYKFTPGEWVMRGKVPLDKGIYDSESIPYLIHAILNGILSNPPAVLALVLGLTFDLTYLAFFILVSKRYFLCFRNSYFVTLINNPHEYNAIQVLHLFRKHHYTICSVVEEMNICFAPMILTWYIMLTVCLCSWIRILDTDAGDTIPSAIFIVLTFCVDCVQFYTLSIGTAMINDEMNNHLDIVRTMCMRERDISKRTIDCFQERMSHLSYMTCIMASPVALTGWGFFSITKGFVLTNQNTSLLSKNASV